VSGEPRNWYNPKAVSIYLMTTHDLKISGQTLARWRCEGRGLAFHSDGSGGIWYSRTTLDQWVQAYRGPERRSTSENPMGGHSTLQRGRKHEQQASWFDSPVGTVSMSREKG
jgi:hypothetical protein